MQGDTDQREARPHGRRKSSMVSWSGGGRRLPNLSRNVAVTDSVRGFRAERQSGPAENGSGGMVRGAVLAGRSGEARARPYSPRGIAERGAVPVETVRRSRRPRRPSADDAVGVNGVNGGFAYRAGRLRGLCGCMVRRAASTRLFRGRLASGRLRARRGIQPLCHCMR